MAFLSKLVVVLMILSVIGGIASGLSGDEDENDLMDDMVSDPGFHRVRH